MLFGPLKRVLKMINIFVGMEWRIINDVRNQIYVPGNFEL